MTAATTTVRDYLVSLDACSDAVEWASQFDALQAAWDECERADWMLWLLARVDGMVYTSRLRLCACACARTALPYTTDARVGEAIHVAERYARGEATDDELAAAGAAAWDAAGDAAGDVAWAAAGDAAGDAAWAAAWAAAGVAAWAAAGAAALRQMADIVRGIVPVIGAPEVAS